MWSLAFVLLLPAVSDSADTRQGAHSPRAPDRGQILVQLQPHSDAGEKVARAAASGAAPNEDVVAYVRSIAHDLGVPLEARRLASGGTVVIALQTEELSEIVATRLARDRSIKSATAVAGPSPRDARVIHVELKPGSRDALQLARSNADTQAPRAITEKLQRLSRVPLKADVHEGKRIRLTIDVPELVSRLSASLRKRPEVRHAQPNDSYSVRDRASVR